MPMAPLPPELLLTAFDHVRQTNFSARIACYNARHILLPASYGLRNVSSACRRFRDICRPLIFEWVHIDGPRIAAELGTGSLEQRAVTFLEALSSDEELRRHVKRLDLKDWDPSQYVSQGFKGVEQTFLRLPRLSRLLISLSLLTDEMLRLISESLTITDVTLFDIRISSPTTCHHLILPNLKHLSECWLNTISNSVIVAPHLKFLELRTSDPMSLAGLSHPGLQELALKEHDTIVRRAPGGLVLEGEDVIKTTALFHDKTFLPELKIVEAPPRLVAAICSTRPVETLRIKTHWHVHWTFQPETLQVPQLRALHLYFVSWTTALLQDISETCPALELLELVVSIIHASSGFDSPVLLGPWEKRRCAGGLLLQASSVKMAQLRSFTLLQKSNYDGGLVTGIAGVREDQLESRKHVEMRQVRHIAKGCPKLNEVRLNTSLYWTLVDEDTEWTWHEWDHFY